MISFCFCGGEGGGKDTQADLLKEFLVKEGYKVVIVREPGGTPLGDLIRKILYHTKGLKINAKAQALLLSAARAQGAPDVVMPALENGTIVIYVRSFYSTYVYQGCVQGVAREKIDSLTDFAVEDIRPDHVFFLRLPAEEGISRKENQEEEMDLFDELPISFHEKVLAGYDELADENKDTWTAIDASVMPEEIHEKVKLLAYEMIKKVESNLA